MDANELLKSLQSKEINTNDFLIQFASVNVYYSTPYGDHIDGGHRVFLLQGPDNTGYMPVFTSIPSIREFYENAGRANYMVMEASFLDFLKTTKKISDSGAPVKLGAIIEPGYYGITVDANLMDKVIEIIEK